MLVVRLARRGRRGRAFYQLVVADKRKAVKKRIVKQLGYYDPMAEAGAGKLDFDEGELTKFCQNGAQLSQTVARLLSTHGFAEAGKFIKARASKPKKEIPPPEDKKSTAKDEITENEVDASDTKDEQNDSQKSTDDQSKPDDSAKNEAKQEDTKKAEETSDQITEKSSDNNDASNDQSSSDEESPSK